MRKIMIIGAGGIGSYLVSFLDRIGLYDITVFDDDSVETKNLTYQNYEEDDVGLEKVRGLKSMVALTMQNHMLSLFSNNWRIMT